MTNMTFVRIFWGILLINHRSNKIHIYTRRKEMANSTGSYGVFFVDLVDGAVAVVGVVSTIKN